MLAFFQQLGKEVDSLKLKISSLNDAGSKGGSNLADEFERFGKVVEHYTRGPIKAMDAAAAGIAKTLLGAGGLAVGFAGVAKALDAFAVGELQLRNFATNTGFTVQSVQNLRTQLSAAGVDASEASSGIASIGSKLQEVLALQETSSFYKSLQASSPALAEQVRQLMNAGKQQEALNVLQQAYNNGGERFKAWLPTVTGLSRAAFEAGKVGMEGLIEPWKFQEGEAAKYHKTMTNLETIGTSLWTDMAYTMIEGINKMMGKEGIDGLNEKAHSFADNFRTFFNTYVMPALATTKQEFDWVVKAFGEVDAFLTKWTGKKKEGEQKDEKDKTLPLGSIRTERAIIDSMNSQLPGGPEGGKAGGLWDWIGKQFSMEAGAAEVEPGSTLLVQETADTDKDSNKLLRDMRDTFQKWDQQKSGGGVVGSGSGAFGVGGNGIGPGAATGGPAGGMGRSGPGAGQSFPQSKGGGGPAETTGDLGDSGPSGTLAEQRAGFKKELEGNPQLKRLVLGAMQHEGGIQSNLEQLMNMAAMRHQTLNQALHSGQYGPVTGRNRIPEDVLRNISAKTAAEGEAALAKVYAGSNITDYSTDQGMRGDPNFDKYMANQKYWGMHKVQGAWFSAHGEAGRRWAEAQRARDAAAGTGVWSGGGKAIPFAPGGTAFHDRFGNPRAAIDNALRQGSGSNTGTATVDINFGDKDKPGSVWEKGASPFIPTNIKRSPQAAIAGGGVTAFNTYSFE
jgi:hypothetical protein